MKTLYLDCFAGISGDMTLGAFLDLGVEEQVLREGLSQLAVEGYRLEVIPAEKQGIQGTKVNVKLTGAESYHHGEYHHHQEEGHDHEHDHSHHGHAHEHYHHHSHPHDEIIQEHHHVNLAAVETMINESGLEEPVKVLSKKIFCIVAEAEATVHGKPIEEVHFHEVGAVDSIVDIVGAAICLCHLKVDQVVVSPLHTGTGFVKCQHGLMPVPVPATLQIIQNHQMPFYNTGIPRELVTPTGAAIAAGMANGYGPLPAMEVTAIGYGAGTRDLEIPNMLRMVLGEKKKTVMTPAQ
ncbi:LarC family nickel insertion protein [Anoxynatronum buryatiense]|uniref:TIGR00299 family protein n=1 Tax=Anoxynatronum buryatiense TaxID=489973 RepID=A0AA46AHU6_9CLOT|nr:LarC family nickel insertion protein [Anoxynatronum buryatiense]SMP43616.1 TIGR00299 family protein [Anoxynatronum buryatiense]